MKLSLILLLPIFCFGQSKPGESVKLLNGKIEVKVPKELTNMSDKMWSFKYHNKPRPALALSDENGEVNFLGEITEDKAAESQVGDYKDYLVSGMKKKIKDLVSIEDGVKTINGKKIGYFKFLSQAIDQKVYNLFFFTVVNEKIILFSFNCIEKLKPEWEKTAGEIMESLKIK